MVAKSPVRTVVFGIVLAIASLSSMIAIQDAPGEEPPFAYHALLRNVELVSGTAGSAGTPGCPRAW